MASRWALPAPEPPPLRHKSTTTIKEREGGEPDHPIHQNLQSDGLHPSNILNAFYALITHQCHCFNLRSNDLKSPSPWLTPARTPVANRFAARRGVEALQPRHGPLLRASLQIEGAAACAISRGRGHRHAQVQSIGAAPMGASRA